MKCFNHPVDAIGVCKHCQRALCLSCCTDLGHGLACKDKHEAEVRHYNSLIENAKRSYEAVPRASYFSAIFLIGMGLAFSYFGFQDGLGSFASVLGLGFIAFGVLTLIMNLKHLKKVTTKY